MHQDDCVFCNIGLMDPQQQVLGARHGAFRIVPLNPVVPGHRLFIPYEHVADAGEDPNVTANVMRYASQYAKLRDVDFNLITSSGVAATQSVKHLHIHYVPREAGDGLRLPWSPA